MHLHRQMMMWKLWETYPLMTAIMFGEGIIES